MDFSFEAFIDEFCKLAARPVTTEEAQKSLKKLKGMKEDRDLGTYARAAGTGAALMPVAGLASRLVAGTAKVMNPGTGFNLKKPGKTLKGINWSGMGRTAAGDAMMGGIGGGLLPLAREGVEQQAQEAKLRRFVEQEEGRGKRGVKRLRQQVTEVTGV